LQFWKHNRDKLENDREKTNKSSALTVGFRTGRFGSAKSFDLIGESGRTRSGGGGGGRKYGGGGGVGVEEVWEWRK
jgi:hypothetical protein